MKIYIEPNKNEWIDLIQRPQLDAGQLKSTVQNVLTDIQTAGDVAVRKYSQKFDGVQLEDFMVSPAELKEAENLVDESLKDAIDLAAKNIKAFHASQKSEIKPIETMDGVTCWQKSVAIEKVGLYIPGGTAPLFSTVLMLAIPAQIAGCKEVVLCSPPNKEGKLHPAILYAAKITGVTKIFKLGGVQAIGAMAYGTQSVPKVYKIFGPGNQYVTTAKQLVNTSGTAIDMPAGPSEVAIMIDSSSNPAFVASDLLAQAEHGKDSHVLLVSRDAVLVDKVLKELNVQLEQLPRKAFAAASISNSAAVVLSSKEDMVSLINEYGPEHLIISMEDYDDIADKIINAGSVFLGNYTPESVGDYASGTNHTLPTYGFAKMYSGVNLDSYMKKITFQEITKEGIQNIGPAVEIMAENELLEGHKKAVSIRLNR